MIRASSGETGLDLPDQKETAMTSSQTGGLDRVVELRLLNADPAGCWLRVVVKSDRHNHPVTVHVAPPAELILKALEQTLQEGRLWFNRESWSLQLVPPGAVGPGQVDR